MLTVTWHVSVVERRAGTTGGARAPGEPGEQTPPNTNTHRHEGRVRESASAHGRAQRSGSTPEPRTTCVRGVDRSVESVGAIEALSCSRRFDGADTNRDRLAKKTPPQVWVRDCRFSPRLGSPCTKAAK